MVQNNGGQIAIRKNNWKYIPATRNRSAELYDLSTDPSELHDVTMAYPEQAAMLKKIVERDYKKEEDETL